MSFDGFAETQRLPVVHQTVARANAPERRGADFITRGLSAILHNSVARADIVQQKVAERMDDFAAECRRNS